MAWLHKRVYVKRNLIASLKTKITGMKKILIASTAILLFISCERKNASKESITNLNREIEVDKSSTVSNTAKGKNQAPSGAIDQTNETRQQKQQDKKTQDQTTPATQVDWDKEIIKIASLNLEVKDYNAYNSSLRDKIKQTGGYVAQEQQTQSDYKIENIITVKVPVDQFDNAVTLITAGAESINEKRITSQDVTTEVIDTRSRFEAKKQVRLRYLDLLKQAKNMEEILNVQSQINGIQEEIESAAGRIEYLSHSSSFSTINLTFYQVLNATAKDTNNPSFSTKLGAAFKNGWSWIGEVFVGIVSIWPLLLMIFAGLIIYKKTRTAKVKQA